MFHKGAVTLVALLVLCVDADDIGVCLFVEYHVFHTD